MLVYGWFITNYQRSFTNYSPYNNHNTHNKTNYSPTIIWLVVWNIFIHVLYFSEGFKPPTRWGLCLFVMVPPVALPQVSWEFQMTYLDPRSNMFGKDVHCKTEPRQ